MIAKVLITTSGIGSRLGALTKDTNKALVEIEGKAVISYIVELYPLDTQFVVTIGYHGAKVRDFLLKTYPERFFEFVTIDLFEGEGSSLGYSMLQARSLLQCPFVFHASDTIVLEPVPDVVRNWIGVYVGGEAQQYSTWKIAADGSLLFQNKGAANFDFVHIGLVGVYEYARYWDLLEELYRLNPGDQSLNDCKVLMAMLEQGSDFVFETFALWCDSGNPTALERARAQLAQEPNR